MVGVLLRDAALCKILWRRSMIGLGLKEVQNSFNRQTGELKLPGAQPHYFRTRAGGIDHRSSTGKRRPDYGQFRS